MTKDEDWSICKLYGLLYREHNSEHSNRQYAPGDPIKSPRSSRCEPDELNLQGRTSMVTRILALGSHTVH